MSKHNVELLLCRNLPGSSVGRLCLNCEGRCPLCDSFVRPSLKARLCEECAFGTTADQCIICGLPGVETAYYCEECVLCARDREGCPRILNNGRGRGDRFVKQVGE